MKILLFGGSGQLGYEVITRARDLNFNLIAPHETELDLGDHKAIIDLSKHFSPDVVINCAAYTAVDKAEEDQTLAYKINRDGARNVAEGALASNSRMIHISTDYVFDGQGSVPLKETDPVNPLNVYGASKLAGEKEVFSVLGEEKGLILRTQSLHGQKGINFVHTMLKLFAEKDRIRVVNDQIMCATWAGWLAETILDLARINVGGVYHASCNGIISWYDFTCGIWEQTKEHFKKAPVIEPCSSAEYPRPAKRPAYSPFDCSKLAATIGRQPITWQEGLSRHLAEIGYKRGAI